MRRLALLFLLSVSISAAINAESTIISSDTGLLSFRFRNINFLRDNEYANPVTEGYTLLGFIIQPTVVWSPISRLNIALGVQVQSYAGTYKIKSPWLIFSTTYRITRNTTIIMGSLDGSEKHRLDDPIFYQERTYTAQTESGLRLFTENQHIFNDVWVNWENFVFKGDTTREIFQVGESFIYTSPVLVKDLRVEFPAQLYFKHFGGQVSDYPEHVETFFNGSFGLEINYKICSGKYGNIGLEYKQLRFRYISRHGTFMFRSGDAYWIRLHYDIGSVSFGSYYWRGHYYYAPDGNPIYSNISERYPNLYYRYRKIWTNSLKVILHTSRFFELLAGAQTYYDIGSGHLDAALVLHLRFDQLITLKRFE